MILGGMRLVKGFKVSALVALAIPAVLSLTAITTLADASPSPTVALPGDPIRGATLYGANCATCHGANLEGGIGAVLNPIDKLPGVTNSLDPTFLILFSDTGGGHRAAARALTDALKQLDPTCDVTVADPLISQGPAVVRRLASLYSPMIQRSRAAWGAVYHSSNTKPTFAAIRAVFGRGVRNVIVDLVAQSDPDVVLSVHPLLNHIAHQAIVKSGRPRALMTVITDLVAFHRGWTFSRAALVLAPPGRARNVAL